MPQHHFARAASNPAWLPAGNLRWIIILAIVGLVVVPAAYAVGATASPP